MYDNSETGMQLKTDHNDHHFNTLHKLISIQHNNNRLRPFVRDYPGEVTRYQKKHSPTHHPNHHPIFISFFHLPRSIASSLFKLRAWQLAIFLRNLSPCPLWSTSWSGALHLIFHTFLHPISVFFSQHIPIQSQPVLP